MNSNVFEQKKLENKTNEGMTTFLISYIFYIDRFYSTTFIEHLYLAFILSNFIII